MKHSIKMLVSIVIVAFTMTRCNKGTSPGGSHPGGNKASLTLSNSSVWKGQPLQATASNAGNASIVKWTVQPSTDNQVFSANNNSTILFAASGSYTVTASYFADSGSAPVDSVSEPIIVIDSVYIPPVDTESDTLSLVGDQLQITPQALNDSGFVLEVRTANLYTCIPYFIGYSWGMVNNNTLTAGFDYISNHLTDNCGGGKSPAGVYLFYGSVTAGDYTIDIEFNHQHYLGSVNVSGGTYTFTWPYSSGVTLSPLQIQKQ